ncbi:hypothetical protein JTB14_022961 [Gonioctena quinquepunctata]|nr:hypothetical protein JTB14_022961 [Gonioctena quinquepunctata]
MEQENGIKDARPRRESAVKSLSQHSSRKSVRSRISKPSSKASQVSLALQKKRLALQVEKERQELERMKHNLEIETEKKQREIKNKMKILHMEHELRNAEIDFAEEEEQSDDQSLPRSELEGKIENVHPSVAEWVSRTVPDPLPEENQLMLALQFREYIPLQQQKQQRQNQLQNQL